MLSFKPPSGRYASLYEKVRHYSRIVRDAARHVDPAVTATPGAAFQSWKTACRSCTATPTRAALA